MFVGVLTGNGIEQPVFMAKQLRWPDDGGFGEGISDRSLTSVLGAVEL